MSKGCTEKLSYQLHGGPTGRVLITIGNPSTTVTLGGLRWGDRGLSLNLELTGPTKNRSWAKIQASRLCQEWTLVQPFSSERFAHGTTVSWPLYFGALLQTGPRTWTLNTPVDARVFPHLTTDSHPFMPVHAAQRHLERVWHSEMAIPRDAGSRTLSWCILLYRRTRQYHVKTLLRVGGQCMSLSKLVYWVTLQGGCANLLVTGQRDHGTNLEWSCEPVWSRLHPFLTFGIWGQKTVSVLGENVACRRQGSHRPSSQTYSISRWLFWG